MNFDEYKEKVLSVESKFETLNVNNAVLFDMLGTAVAVAEVIDALKKVIVYGKALDITLLDKLIGDLQFEAMCLRSSLDIPVAEVVDIEECGDPKNVNIRLFHAAVGMFGEAGEMLNALRGQLVTGTLDKVNFSEELGDSAWYETIAIDELGTSLEVIREQNIKKLLDKKNGRYKSGSFSSDQALNRDTSAERKLLEGEE